MPLAESLNEPWRSFLHDVDGAIRGLTEIHCFGGFVIAEYYGLTRPTAVIDILEAKGSADLKFLSDIAGRGTALARKHKVFLDIVTIAKVPENYDNRLIPIFERAFKRLRLRAFEKHDLALAKLSRNADHDREDVKRLAMGPGLDADLIRRRYYEELRYQFGNPGREDLTLELWVEMISELRGQR